jgi:hypothetical protein
MVVLTCYFMRVRVTLLPPHFVIPSLSKRAKEWNIPSLVVDVGANVFTNRYASLFHQDFYQHAIFVIFLAQVAYFSLLALSLGCRVIALEPALHMMP